MSTTIVSRHWYRPDAVDRLVAEIPTFLVESGFAVRSEPAGSLLLDPTHVRRVQDERASSVEWGPLVHASTNIDVFGQLTEVESPAGRGATFSLSADNRPFRSPDLDGALPAQGVLFEASSIAFHQRSAAHYGYLSAVDFEVSSLLGLSPDRFSLGLKVELDSVCRDELLYLHPVNYLPEAMLGKYPRLRDYKPQLLRRVALPGGSVMLGTTRGFLWDELVDLNDMMRECGISQDWRWSSRHPLA